MNTSFDVHDVIDIFNKLKIIKALDRIYTCIENTVEIMIYKIINESKKKKKTKINWTCVRFNDVNCR